MGPMAHWQAYVPVIPQLSERCTPTRWTRMALGRLALALHLLGPGPPIAISIVIKPAAVAALPLPCLHTIIQRRDADSPGPPARTMPWPEVLTIVGAAVAVLAVAAVSLACYWRFTRRISQDVAPRPFGLGGARPGRAGSLASWAPAIRRSLRRFRDRRVRDGPGAEDQPLAPRRTDTGSTTHELYLSNQRHRAREKLDADPESDIEAAPLHRSPSVGESTVTGDADNDGLGPETVHTQLASALSRIEQLNTRIVHLELQLTESLFRPPASSSESATVE
ncbi:hypothetical protein MIND_00550300 [Mycena indigotica]|uniref:Uncharacterized protein n=1 Tax=Mycena indigotica TaxID=2126181 RepID=A0A8H6T144_9AGAR|nr:uncharacterized protein MIND_00550300 [Mycena indigotica]KAF7307555.1 hypothetical protein MIND_00550300 [Mycena indigotica]